MNEEARNDKMENIRKELALNVVKEMAKYIAVMECRDVLYAPTDEIIQIVTRMAQKRVMDSTANTHVDTYFNWMDVLDDYVGIELHPLYGVSNQMEPKSYEETTMQERVDIYMLHSAIGTALLRAWCDGVSEDDMEEALMIV